MNTALLIDSDPALSESLRQAAAEADCELVTVQTIEDARDALSQWTFPLVIFETALPDGDALAFANEIEGGSPSTRLCIVSDRESTQADGTRTFLRRPVSREDALGLFSRTFVPALR